MFFSFSKFFSRVLFLKFCTKTWQKFKIPKRKLSEVILMVGFFSLVTILVIDESRRPLLQLFESTQLNFFFLCNDCIIVVICLEVIEKGSSVS